MPAEIAGVRGIGDRRPGRGDSSDEQAARSAARGQSKTHGATANNSPAETIGPQHPRGHYIAAGRKARAQTVHTSLIGPAAAILKFARRARRRLARVLALPLPARRLLGLGW